MNATGQNDADVVVATYAFYGDGRRARKQVQNRGDLDRTIYFYYDGQQVIEERDGSERLYQQYVWGPNYIDELVMMRGANGAYWAYAGERSERAISAEGKAGTRPAEGHRPSPK